MKKYVINVFGNKVTLTSDDPFYWTSRTETVCGWYYGNGNYTDKLREEWSVNWDQNVYWDQNVASNQNKEYYDGYQSSDFLYAPAQEVSFGKDTPLKFYHQTARVVINILNADAATSADQIEDFYLYIAPWGRYTAPMQKGATVGTWEVLEWDQRPITPKDITTPTSGYLKTYTALVIPQDMTDKEFFTIQLDDYYTYHYFPKKGEANLEGGKQYTYDVTVKIGYLNVKMREESGKWDGDDTPIEVTGKPLLPEYAPDKLKIGDYYYSDGTTSDGGYRKYSDGTTDLLPIKPLEFSEENPRTVIGIVYSTDVDRIGETAKTFLKNEKNVEIPNGLVMALTNSEQCRWGNPEMNENSSGSGPFSSNTDQFCKMYDNVDGYGETKWIIENHNQELSSNYVAFYNASRYEKAVAPQYAAPDKTTGWFIPSIGQWCDILSNLGEINISDYQSSEENEIKITGAAPTAVNNINRYLNKVNGTDTFKTGDFYWSSSEFSDSGANRVDFSEEGPLRIYSTDKRESYDKVRCVLAF